MCSRQILHDIIAKHVSQNHKVVIHAEAILCQWVVEYCEFKRNLKYVMVSKLGREAVSIRMENYQVLIFESSPIYQDHVSGMVNMWSKGNDRPDSSQWVQCLILDVTPQNCPYVQMVGRAIRERSDESYDQIQTRLKSRPQLYLYCFNYKSSPP